MARKTIILLIVLTLFLRLPSLFEPFTYGDEGIYLTLGQAAKSNLVWYRDIHDNKPPLLYLLAALAGNFTFFRLILFSWSWVTIYFFYKLSRSSLATFAFAILISVHTFEGNVANAENFMLGTTIAGFYLYLRAKKRWQFFVTGILFSLSTLFKVPAAFDFAALLAFAFVSTKKRNYQLLITDYLLLIFGFFLPILITFIYYSSQNALGQYLSLAFFQNLPYLSSWSGSTPKAVGLPLPLLGRAGLVFLVCLVTFIWRKKLSKIAQLVLIWFSFSLFGALLSARPYPHYLLQAIPALALSITLLIRPGKEKIIPLLMILVFYFSFNFFHFWHYQNISYYQNFYQFCFGQKNKNQYFEYFGNQTQALYQTATYLRLYTSPGEKIFVWSNQPSIYPLAQRLPVGRYAAAYHIIDFNGYQETMTALTKNPPRFMVIAEEKHPFPEFFSFIQARYSPEIQFGEFRLFRRKLNLL